MAHEWMIRVLEDLLTYARLHGLTALAEMLDQARMLAIAEIANLEPRDRGGGDG
ncbi:MAG: hypothetical protein H6900_06910 [Rhodobacter sp.]|uniref:hypothetical protein n=1 Tax=Pararhodobacter sp. TaxID=2127056 RepID=UPI001D54398D|nr:hypothetical protein [Pararhodobacter sp.]MCB1346288.1 hypothetical protein [Paracoccaceae bacterium]MCC0073005.1 hypothetical protein [Rhodobacter sp.]HPD93815.1 hypothetical protein [Pararhodobacter sp.]